ncbi:MAG TPA: right-handed parallel beta-helix repeat-containing protein, partial [Planctomycetota bacterium]|nr:right-handed parallel beta-helix repeat-containing protein [Planctomycetota bacterium]
MRFFAALLMGATLMASCSRPTEPPRQANADFVVAPDGDDAGPGTAAQPFATPARARDAVRQLVAAGLAKDVTVRLRGGTYCLPQGIAFGPEDSGTAEHRITYAAWPGEVPILVGGVPVTGWTPHAAGIWRAAIPEGIQPTQLFENGERLALARAPTRAASTS